MLSVQTPAKINLFLNIRPRRPDGFHEISSVMQAIQLFDRLDFTPNGTKTIGFSCNIAAFEQAAADNLVVKAYRLFWEETGLPPLGLNVHLEKTIPTQAGLGGGSSDAAAMLLVLNHLTCAGLGEEQLRALGAKLGSDVPFFIQGGMALVSGRGEIVQPLPTNLVADLSLVIVKPRDLNIDTSLAYHRFATGGRYEVKSPDHILMAIQAIRQKRRLRDEIELDSYLLNDFESVLFLEYPILGRMAREMKELGIRRPLLSGSGSAMIGFVESTHTVRKAFAERFPRQQFEVFWTRTYPGGLRQVREQADVLTTPLSI
ncbi:MAG TPA: 4-(cytidine 5'-diphospho)-2-C-methyl-D-erythritol kinase [Oculatellaceae cyanobacterium]|jgi:4-diphosphocytidyl-2-C-methyl-D-erythritol kinase